MSTPNSNVYRPQLQIEICRGGYVESRHLATAVIWHVRDGLIAGYGDVSISLFPRSAIKMLQALPYVLEMQSRGIPTDPRRLALATASHWGEQEHISVAKAWLQDLGLSEEIFSCGAHAPYNADEAARLLGEKQPFTRLHNNCSGKHLAMIHTCLLKGEDPKAYFQVDQPCQQRVISAVARMGEFTQMPSEWGTDGCGIPAYRMPLTELARAMSRFASFARIGAENLGEASPEQRACATLYSAMSAYPVLIGGHGDETTRLTELGQGRFIVKVGAEGVMVAASPERELGIVIKVQDGGGRAVSLAMAHLLSSVGLLDSAYDPAIHPRPTRNWAGLQVGENRIVRSQII